MGREITPARTLQNVVQWLVHQGYNIDVVSVTVNTGGLAVGASLMGKLGIFAGGVWKNSIAGDTYTAGTTILGVILKQELILSALVANAVITKVPMLVRGPAMVHDDAIDYTGHNVATTRAVLLERGIKVVDETGLAYSAVQN